ncbi:MAG TPA: DNA repair protein RecO [Mesorhizobium sp.]|nr:DNA repair protein RecO [Mesorhizobium sp.]
MEWRDEGVVLGARQHGETSVILEVMTRAHGRHLGLVHGGRSRQKRPMLQAGNQVELTWRARLDEQLGTYAVEPVALHAARLMDSAVGVYALQALAFHLRLLPERDPHPAIYEALVFVLDHLGEPVSAGALLVRFELLMLDELGFGLDLSECSATGAKDDLVHVSPKSGRAVSRAAGEPYRDRLLPLPMFLRDPDAAPPGISEIEQGFALTGSFLMRRVLEPQGLRESPARTALITALRRELAPQAQGT